MATVMKPTPTRSDAAPARLRLVGIEPAQPRWSRRRTVTFVVISCTVLWIAIAMAVWLIA
jgi:hypothetical protein